MITDAEFLNKLWPQNCGDTLKILEKSITIKDKSGQCLWKCLFQKYPYEIYLSKVAVIRGNVVNPQIEKEEFINKFWLQNCGDSLKIIEKISNTNFWKCQFQKYFFETKATKRDIIKGSVDNPQIEQIEFIQKEWPQNCGDTLRITEKTSQKKNNKYLFRCQFKKYPFEILALKDHIVRGVVNNPQIEQVEFIEKIWPQNCGDILKIIKKSNKKQGEQFLWEAEFVKCPYKIITSKSNILAGTVVNPLIEQKEFIKKLWPQFCGDTLKIIKKTNKKDIYGKYLWKCEFTKYPCKVLESKSHIIRGYIENPNLPWKKKENLEKYLQDNYKDLITLSQLSKDLGISITRIGQIVNQYNLRSYIKYQFGIQEQIVREFVNSLGFEGQTKTFGADLGYKEIDIYIPEKNFGIEYNGNIWHSTKFKAEQNYHQEKTLEFKEKLDIQLFHIFEYEWDSKQEILQSLIKSKLGLFDKKIGARQCEVKVLSNIEYQNFCNINHLQGEAGAKVKLGLTYKDELVQVMSFSLPRFTDKYDWEIIRECSKLGYWIIGGKEKLWKYFVQHYNPQNCISYCDFGKFSGDSYLKLGFKFEALNKPGFVWYDEQNNQIFWRNPYKNREMQEKGYFKIWDVGQLVFTWKREN